MFGCPSILVVAVYGRLSLPCVPVAAVFGGPFPLVSVAAILGRPFFLPILPTILINSRQNIPILPLFPTKITHPNKKIPTFAQIISIHPLRKFKNS